MFLGRRHVKSHKLVAAKDVVDNPLSFLFQNGKLPSPWWDKHSIGDSNFGSHNLPSWRLPYQHLNICMQP